VSEYDEVIAVRPEEEGDDELITVAMEDTRLEAEGDERRELLDPSLGRGEAVNGTEPVARLLVIVAENDPTTLLVAAAVEVAVSFAETRDKPDAEMEGVAKDDPLETTERDFVV
jgi:hypothetical protein